MAEHEAGTARSGPAAWWMRASPERRARVAVLAVGAGLALLLVLLGSPWQVPTGPGFAAPLDRPLRHTVQIALFWAGAVNVLVCLGLAATAGFWARRLVGDEIGPAPPRRLGRPALCLILLAVVVAGALRLPLASKSLWWDEGWSLSRVIIGPFEPDPEQPRELRLRPMRWSRTLWYYRKPTNHVTYSVASRATLSAWRATTNRAAHEFDELVFRAPALLASLASVLLMGLLGWRWGFPRAGAFAAWLLALHPWHIRYGVEGRAYGFLVLFSLLAALALTEALRSRSWRWFAVYGATQLALLWSHPFAIHLTLAMGLCGLAGCLLLPGTRRDRLTVAARFVVVNGAAGMLLLQLMAPNFAQALSWHAPADLGSGFRPGQPLDYWSRMATGIALEAPVPPEDPDAIPSIRKLAEAGSPWAPWATFAFLPALALLGVTRLRGPPHVFWVAAGLVLSIPLTFAIVQLAGELYYHRFVIYGLPAVVLAVALGADALAAPLDRLRSGGRLAGAAALGLGLVAFQGLVLPQTRLLLERPYAPLRDVAELFQEKAGDDPLSVLRAGFGLEGRMPGIYDPWIRYLDTPGDLARICGEAREKSKPLYVFYAQPRLNRRRRAEGFVWLDDPAFFVEVARYPGIEGRFLFTVLRYTGEPLPGDNSLESVSTR